VSDLSSSFAGSENPLSESSLWTSGPGAWGDLQKVSGLARAAATSTFSAARANDTAPGAAIGADQYSQVTLTTLGAGNPEGGPTCRMASTTDGDCYLIDAVAGDGFYFFRCTDGGTLSFTQLGAKVSVTPVAGDTLKLVVTGTTLESFRNGVSQGTRTDATFASGQPGLWIWAATLANRQQDDWLGGDGSEPSSPPPPPPATTNNLLLMGVG
jgi:hypothetical protein